MSGFLKTNIYIFIYMYVLFCRCDSAESEKICIACEDKQWCFTLDKTSEFGNQFYRLLENRKSLTLAAYIEDGDYASISIDPADITISEFPSSTLDPKAGDIMLYEEDDDFYLDFIYQDTNDYTGLKVGELEESSLEDFKSFILGKYDEDEEDYLDFTFSIEESPQLGPKIIVITIIWLLLLLPLIFLVYFIFK